MSSFSFTNTAGFAVCGFALLYVKFGKKFREARLTRKKRQKRSEFHVFPAHSVRRQHTKRKRKEGGAFHFVPLSFPFPQQLLALFRLVRAPFKFCFCVRTWLQFRLWLSAPTSQLPPGCSHSAGMLSWGQDCRRGALFHPAYSVREVSASRGARAFVSGDGHAFVVRGDESDAGGTGKVKPSEFSVPLCGERLAVGLVAEQNKTLLSVLQSV